MEGQRADLPEALEVLGNEIRMDIIRELADADGALAFTELRERVGVRDTGKFNYHLTRLCRYFVREAESGYELGHAGTRLIAAVESREVVATPDAEVNVGDSEDSACPVCGDEGCGKLFHVHLRPGGR